MAKRATRTASTVFANVLAQAEQRLILDAGSAENLEHRGLRGGERAEALAAFLRLHLPNAFSVGRGEAIDFRDNRTGEIDVFVFDRSTAAPIQSSTESQLIPAEALYAVIEVKSVLTQDEIDKSYKAAQRVRSLKPFKGNFIAAPTDGSVQDQHYRCPYYVFAYTTNLSSTNWAQKEYDRTKKSVADNGLQMDLVDRLFVVDRGILHPQIGAATLITETKGVFLDFYTHLVNFLNREKQRRPTIDWQAYSSTRKWLRLT